MCINPNAEVELKSPKANLHLEVQNIAIEMTKPQVLLCHMAYSQITIQKFGVTKILLYIF